ncbi:MAG: hypothetical protein JRI95_08200 [Deltaproteobacteria bacterium]|nr:hypothetical protein [Deltaproteobacteria bacterium]
MTNKIELCIHERSDFANGHVFGDAGPYERIRGRAHFMVDPDAPTQAGVFDIDKAPRNEKGLVEFSGDFLILKPVEPSRGNKRLFYDFGNRGNMRTLQFFNDAPGSNDPKTLEHAGNGFLFRRGYTVVWSAWQGDLLPGNDRVLLNLPVATDGGKPLTGRILQEFTVYTPGITTRPLSGWTSTRSHPTVSLDTRKARLTKRRYPYNERIEVPHTEWSFARTEGGEGADGQGAEIGVIPSETNIYLPKGFEPGWIYELVYTGRDPLVLGLGDVAVRDLVSFLRYEEKDAAGNPNPAGEIEKAYAWGRSQTGRLIRDFVYRGFNAAPDGRRVFDGVLPHVSGGGLMWMHHRFANLTASAGQAYMEHFIYSDRFPFSYASCTDHLTGKTDAILKRPDTDPLVIHTQTSTEYWERHGSLVHTDTKGNDLPQPENVRIYLWSSSMHFADPQQREPIWPPVAANRFNNIQTSFFFRAMLDAMDRWATDGTPPPDSMIPSRENGTLATYEEWVEGFPKIPGQALPPGPSTLPLLDFGPEADDGFITKLPPDIKDLKGYTILVPSVNADGNEIAGVRSPVVQAPLGTYTGWNLRRRGWGHGATLNIQGSYIPFMDTPEEREMTRDPRLSVLERYGSPEGYVEAVRAAAERLVDAGIMLEEDIERVVAMAANWGRPRHDVKL